MKYYRNKDGKQCVSPNQYQGNHDLVAKFRVFENDGAQASAKSDLESYVDIYQSGPLTKAELLNRMADGLPVDPNFANKWQIKRAGKDKDDIFWALGKIHGLENVAFMTDEQIKATGGDPFKLQAAVDQINDSEKPNPPAAHDSVVNCLSESLENYKNVMMAIE